jgi:hypothetical protein
VVKVAAGSEAVMELLFNRRGGEVKITEEVIKAAATNEMVLALLLDRRGGEVKRTLEWLVQKKDEDKETTLDLE